MAATQVGIVHDTVTGQINIIRLPDDDSQLDDPSLNYSGCTRVKMKRADYDKLQGFPLNVVDIAPVIIPGSALVTVAAVDIGS